MRTQEQFYLWLSQAPDEALSTIQHEINWVIEYQIIETPDDLPEDMTYDQLKLRKQQAREWLAVTFDHYIPFGDLEGLKHHITNLQMDRLGMEPDFEENRDRIEQPETTPYDPDDDIPF